MRWTILALRRLVDDRAPTLGLVVLVLVTALVAALAPRVLASQADQSVRADVMAAPAAARNLVLQQRQLIFPASSDDPLSEARAAGRELEATLPAGVRSLIARRDVVVESGRFRVQKDTTDPAFIRFRIQEGIDAQLTYVAGHAPTATIGTRDDVGPQKVDGVPVYEAGISEATARAFGVAVGETVPLIGDPGDPLVGRNAGELYAFATITGIYHVTDPGSDYWLDDPLPIHPVIRALSAEVQLLDAALLVDEGTLGALDTHASSVIAALQFTWRSFLDPARISDRRLAALITDFRRLQVEYPSANVTTAADTAMRSGMLAILQSHQARWTAAESIIAVMALGPALVAVATLALVGVLAAGRRRATMALARSRGGSTRQVILPTAVEGLVVALPGTVAGVVVAMVAIPAGRLSMTLGAAGLVALVALAVVVASVVPVARSRGLEPRTGARVVTRVGARRIVLEALLVALAVGAAALLRQRGVNATSSAGDVAGFDPLIAAVPALVGVGAGIVVTRAYPVPLRLIAWIAARGRGLVPVLAARRAMEGGATAAVLLVLLATATVGAFAASALDNLERGADLSAWQEIGGPVRLQPPSGALPGSLDPATLPGVQAASGVFEATVPIGLSGPQVLFVIPEAGALESAVAGTPADPRFPPGFTTPGSGPIPAIVSRSLAGAPQGVKEGDVFTTSIEGYTLEYRAVEVRDTFPGLPAGRHFVIASREWFTAKAPAARIVPVVEILRAPDSAAGAIRDAVATRAPAVSVVVQGERAAALRTQPVTQAVRSLVLVAAVVTAAYAALGVAAALALAAIARTQEVAHLRTLGLTGRQTFGLALAEHGPSTLTAFAIGGALGVVLFVVLRPGLGLASLVGSPLDVPVVLEAGPLLLILGAMVAVVAVGLVLGTALQRRVSPTAAIRGQFE